MTNSEAIEWLKEIPRAYGVRRDKEPCEAFALAIKALDRMRKHTSDFSRELVSVMQNS
jgi:uncharacterized Zn finger protein